MKCLLLIGLFAFISCNNSAPTKPEITINKITLPGYKNVQYSFAGDEAYVMFEPAIAKDDDSMTDAFVAIADKVYSFTGKLPIQDIVSTPRGNAIRYQYGDKSLLFLPMKNDDGTIHTVIVSKK